ncbi:MAG: quinone-dependent dihydroorotate dehydrogenase [Pseudomonadota bacterium]
MSALQRIGLPLVKAFPPETAHTLTIAALKSGVLTPVKPIDPPILRTVLPKSKLDLSNPVGLAAGFDKNAEVFAPMLAFGFGFVECGTVTPRPQSGNPRPRLFRLSADKAVINRMGFNNSGLGAFVRRLAAAPAEIGCVGANVGANKDSQDRVADYVAGVKAVWPYCRYLTINISSPNTPGLRGLQERGALEDLLGRVDEAAAEMAEVSGPKPIFLKIAPDMDDTALRDVAEVALATSSLTGLIVSNTTIARPDSLISYHRGEAGGLSGAPLLEPSTAVLKQIAIELKGRLDLIGAGGISDAVGAYSKIRAGAQAVQLYSALVYKGPALVGAIKSGLADMLKADGFQSVSDAVGAGLG